MRDCRSFDPLKKYRSPFTENGDPFLFFSVFLFFGQVGHITARPANAISRIVLSLDELVASHSDKGLLLATVIQIDVGERAFGVAAHDGRLLLTIRGQQEAELDLLQTEILQLVESEANKEELQWEYAIYDEFPETYNAPETVVKLREIANDCGWLLNEMEEPIRASEDFGYYLKKAPGALIWLGAGENWPAIHSEEYDYNDGLLEKTVDLFWELVKRA